MNKNAPTKGKKVNQLTSISRNALRCVTLCDKMLRDQLVVRIQDIAQATAQSQAYLRNGKENGAPEGSS